MLCTSIFQRHPEGVVAITFKEPEEADVCIEALNGRWFAKKRLTAMAHDGKKKYHVDETEEEYMKRLKQWEDFLEEAAGDKKDKKTGNGMEHSGDVQSKGKQSEGKQSNDEAQSEPVQSDAKQLAEKCSENSGNLQAGENVSENVQSMGEQSKGKQSSDVHIEKKWSKDSESKSKQSEDSGNGQPMENISENLQSTDEQSDGKQSEKTILNVNQEEKEDSAMNMTVN
ncbi:hypothetical protein LSH36_355g01025 [Paralvinella palmiformis]|uniref:RRM domain-containing protein n=1 Tax=Paralvinella palmiformis TaxID=53620 RepID=A0AAD9MZL4_9ANNE|nr:hypothetical protein LSH36_355g01025 [Paralvinella palmiformis]